jgi:hypothetical protein
MPKFRHYSPQLSKEIVCRLYHRAKAKRIPMTVLANQLIEEALENERRTNADSVAENQQPSEPM